MKLIKALFVVVLFALIAFAAVQNLDVLHGTATLGLDWPEALAFTLELPLYVLIAFFFALGFGLVFALSLREHLGQRHSLQRSRKEIEALERELAPPPAAPAPVPEPSADAAKDAEEIRKHPHPETELAMDTATPTTRATEIAAAQDRPQPETQPAAEPQEKRQEMTEAPRDDALRDEEVLTPRPGPGWGTVLLLAAALALVLSGGVYIVVNERLTELAAQMDDVTGLTGHLSSVQQEMSRTWEQERILVREELGVLNETTSSLTEEVQALAGLPEEVRMRLVAGFLRDTASRAAYLVTQMESDEQRETLQGIHERLQGLALELEEVFGRGEGQ